MGTMIFALIFMLVMICSSRPNDLEENQYNMCGSASETEFTNASNMNFYYTTSNGILDLTKVGPKNE